MLQKRHMELWASTGNGGPMRREKKPRKCDKSFVSKFANTLLVGYKFFISELPNLFSPSHTEKKTRTWHWRSFELKTQNETDDYQKISQNKKKEKKITLEKVEVKFPGLIRSKIRRRLIANPKKMTSEMMKTMFFRSCFQFGTHATTHFSIW